MSFLRSPITAGPVRPSILTGIFSYKSHCFCVFVLFTFICCCFLSLVTTVLVCPLELTGGLLTNHQCFDLWNKNI